MDVSSFQGNVDWRTAYGHGARFVYIKATESTGYINPYFGQQYNGSKSAGLIRGAYHFGLPNRSSGVTQANYFVDHGGNWSGDGSTLPPMLDIEYDPYSSNICYGLSASTMVTWIRDFSNQVHTRTGRYPTIYTTRNWWNTCTGSSAGFGSTNPLFIACYCRTVGAMPAGWRWQTIWQYNDQGTFPGDQDVFNGSMADLRRFALT
jgi:GH25 family lysozyme M1 (1,4-beta-N-acetylmuramidase)